jgi:TolA-binding protein
MAIKAILISGWLFLSAHTLYAQTVSNVSAQATSVLLSRAREIMAEGSPGVLLPYLQELLVRLEGNTADDAQAARAFCMYQIGVSHLQLEQYAEAATAFETFLKSYPEDSSAPTAALLTAEAYILQQNWTAAEKTVRPLLTNKKMDESKHRLMVRQLLSEALYRQQKWQEATVPLLEVFKLAEREAARSSAALMLSVCYAKTGSFESLYKFLPYCGESVRQDAGLNMALIESGDKKTADGAYQEALNLYRMVFMKDELIGHYGRQLKDLEAFLAVSFVQRIGATRSAYDEAHRAKQIQHDRLAAQLKSVREGSDYGWDIALRIARCYAGLQRNWVAYTLFNDIYTRAPQHVLAEESRFQAFMLLLNMPQERAAAEAEGLAYLEHSPAKSYTDEVTLNLMQLMLMAGRVDAAQAMGTRALTLKPDHRFLDQIRYLLTFIDFQKQEYQTARDGFKEIRTRWPTGLYAEASEYWYAMCQLFLGQFGEAIASFEAYLKNPAWPKKSFDEDASYRLGIAQYGAGDYQAAESTFFRFLELYPLSVLRSEAFSMLGDLRGAEGDLVAALDFYKKGLDQAATIEQVNYAVFQTAKVYELQKDFPSVIRLMEGYLAAQGEKGNFAGAGFWMGKAYKAMNQYSKAISTYVDTVVRFGNARENDDVDLILRELIKEHRSEQGQAAQAAFMNTLNNALRRAESRKEETLALRLRTLFAYTSEGPARERYIAPVLKTENIEKSGALTLLLMAEEAFLRKQYALVHQVYTHFTTVFTESEILADIMNIKLHVLVREKKYPEAVTLAEEITNRFGYQAQIGLTRKLKADALRLSNQLDAAVKTYNELFAVREWRGPLTPEALYWIGICLETQGKHGEAFAFFQRVYVLYEGYPEWTAKAYAGSVRSLEKLGRREDMIRTLQEMLANATLTTTPEGKEARIQLDRLVPAGGKK